MTQGERVKLLRNSLNLSQEKFGERINMKKNSISQIENGVNNLTDIVAKSISNEFNVNYFWLRDGEGDMYIDAPETVIDELKRTYDLSEFEEKLLKQYLVLSKDERDVLQKIIKGVFHIEEKKWLRFAIIYLRNKYIHS